MNLILLHGFCESTEIWKNLLKHLDSAINVFCLDLPGFGNRSPITHITIEEMADDVHRQIQELNLDRYYMIGHSMGGYVTLSYAQKYSAKLKGIGLFHSTPFADSDEKKQNRLKTIEFIEANGPAKFIEVFVSSLFSEENKRNFSSEIKQVYRIASGTSASSIIAALHAMKDRQNSEKFIQEIEVPVLYILGKKDGFVNFKENLELALKTDHYQICTLENVAHMGMYEDFKACAGVINGFILGYKNNFIRNIV